MKLERVYIGGCVLVGAMQVVDGIALATYGITEPGRVFSLVEMAWVPVSILAYVALLLRRSVWWLPAAYVAYNVVGWVVAAYLMLKANSPEITEVPVWFALTGTVFGMWMTGAGIRFLRRGSKVSGDALASD